MRFQSLIFIFCLFLGQSVYAQHLDYSKLSRLISTSEQLAEYPGRVQFHMINVKPTPAVSTLEMISGSPYESHLVGMLMLPQPARKADEDMLQFLRKIEQLVFKRQGVIDLSFSREDDTRMFYAHRSITLNLRDFERYAVFPDARAFKMFIVAHEFAHFLISSHEITHGASPNNLVSAFFIVGLDPSLTEQAYIQKLTHEIMHSIDLAHAEVDALACLILKKLKEPLPKDPMDILAKVYKMDAGPIDPSSLKALHLRRDVINECRSIPLEAL